MLHQRPAQGDKEWNIAQQPNRMNKDIMLGADKINQAILLLDNEKAAIF